MVSRFLLDNETKSNLIKIFGNFVAFFIVLMFSFLWDNFAKTAKRGFFCNDETLMATFHSEVVPFEVLLIVTIVVPIITIIVIELFAKSQHENCPNESFKIFNFVISQKIVTISHYVSTFLVGFVINLLVTQMGKYLVARYRPHFLTSCQPVFPDGTNCSDAKNIGRSIDIFECTNPLEDDFEDLQRSWPSGHSSVSFYSMIFLSMYIFMKKNVMKELRLLKNSIQFVFISFAWISSLSRIGDNKHHWTDVLSGAIIGTLIALVIITQNHSTKISSQELSSLPTINRKSRNESVETLRL